MPLIQVKLIQNALSSEQKREIIERLTDATVEVLAILSKAQAAEWLRARGEEEPGGAAGQGEG